MHLGAQGLDLLLVGDAEVLLLVDHQQAEILERDGLAEQRVGADHDVDRAVGEALLRQLQLGVRDQPRGLRDLHRKPAEAVGEGLVVLARQQRRRHDDGDLLAAHRRDEGGAQRHLGLAETDVAAHEAIHRLAGGEIVDHRIDDGLLVLGLVVGEAGAELLVHAVRHGQARRLAQQPRGGDLDQLARHLADAVLQPRLARLPAGAAEPVELDAGLLRAVAREQLDVLDRQIELGVLGVVQLEAVVRRAARLDGLQADETADAVIDMHHEIAGIEAGDLGDEIFRPLRGAAAAHQPVAEDVLLGDDREIVGLEAGFEPEHRERDLGSRALERIRVVGDVRQIGEPVVGEHVAHALARAVRPHRDDDALAVFLQRVDVLGHRVEDVRLGLVALGREIAALARAGIDRRGVRIGKRREPRQRAALEPRLPLVFGEIEPVRRQRLVDRAGAVGVERLPARLVVVGDLREALVRGVFGERLHRDRRAGQIIEQRVELGVEQRQPVLHAGMAAAFRDRLVERIARRGAERFHIALAETADRLGGELKLGHRHEIERAQGVHRALRLGIERADRLQRVAEEVEPHRIAGAGRIEIDDAAAHRVVARLAHRGHAVIAVELQPFGHAVHRQHVAGRGGERLRRDQVARRARAGARR